MAPTSRRLLPVMVAISASVHPATTPRVTGAPEVMKRVIDDPLAPADLCRRTARMLLAQHACDLRLGEVAFVRVRLLEVDGLSLTAWDQEGAGHAVPARPCA